MKRTAVVGVFVFLFIFTAIAYSQDIEQPIIAKVKTKAGKEYNFKKFQIGENHYSTRGYMIGGKVQFFPMFIINVDTGDFLKNMSINEVEAITFVEVKKNSFKIKITARDKKEWNLLLTREYMNAGNDDGVSGTEEKYGEISIPFNKIDTIFIIDPKKIDENDDVNYSTNAKIF